MKKFFVVFSTLVVWFIAPKITQAATLYLSPASGSFPVGTSFNVSVRTNTQSQAVNTAEATISYSSDTLTLVQVAGGSTFPLQTPGSPSKSGGRAYFSGGIPTPG